MTLTIVHKITEIFTVVLYVFPEPQRKVRLLPPYQWQTTN
jgi:hypothetical protein